MNIYSLLVKQVKNPPWSKGARGKIKPV